MQELYAAVEYATPVRAIDKLSALPHMQLPPGWVGRQVNVFCTLLQEIIQQNGLAKVIQVTEVNDQDYAQLGR